MNCPKGKRGAFCKRKSAPKRKAAGIRRLTERMGLHPERIYTVGDSKNDLDMLTAPDFIGTAMETSMQSVLDQVARTTPSVEALIRRLL